jgi:hypothetical protein
MVDNIEKTTLENKQYISEMAKNLKIENMNFCNSRIADLMDMDELVDLINDDSIIKGSNVVSEIKIKTKLCSSNLNNIGNAGADDVGGIRRTKTVYDLPGFAELSRLYNDKYNASKGRFDKMSAKSKEEKKRNVDLLYTLFTGKPNPLQSGMFNGETLSPPNVIGPPHPTPHASRCTLDCCICASISFLSAPHTSDAGVWVCIWDNNSPLVDTTPTASFVPPMSMARKPEELDVFAKFNSARSGIRACLTQRCGNVFHTNFAHRSQLLLDDQNTTKHR